MTASWLRPIGITCGLGCCALLSLAVRVHADWPGFPTANVPIGVATGLQLVPEAVSDGAGGAIIAWLDQRVDAGDIYAQRVLASGVVDPAWPIGGRAVCATTGAQGNLRVLPDDAGGAYLVWQDQRSGQLDIYAHHILSSGQLDPVWPALGLPVCTADSAQAIPALAPDGTGGAYVAWYDRRFGTYDIYVHHLTSGGSLDPAWPAQGLVICDAAGDQTRVRIVRDAGGGATCAWQDLRAGSSDIYAHRVLVGGTVDPTWPINGRGVCVEAGNQQFPELCSDGVGGVFVGWVDNRSGPTSDIYASRIVMNGSVAPTWPVTGRPICTAVGDQTAVSLLANAPGEAVLAWVDARSGTQDIYAQRSTGPDGANWAADGVAVCSAALGQSSPRMASDGAGGVIVAWQDSRSGNSDIYAQNLTASGAVGPTWPLNGRGICTSPFSQASPAVLDDGTGGAIVAWQDSRSGPSDIYAQRVMSSGQLGGSVSGVSVPDESQPAIRLTVSPNPCRPPWMTVNLAIRGSEQSTLELFDLAGRRVCAQDLQGLPPGRHTIRLPLERGIPSGVYLIALRDGENTSTARVAILE